jgi:poly(3-hydroxybutyrate) depolymerase/chitodextrinase
MRTISQRFWRWTPVFFALVSGAVAQPAPATLPAYDVDPAETSVSGLSSGGYMAVQFGVAYSAALRGAGVVAGGPYFCAQGDQNTATSVCSCTGFQPCSPSATTDVPTLIRRTDQNATRGLIDPTANLSNHRVWLFSGRIDSVVLQRVMNDLATYYGNYVPAANIAYKKDLDAEHAMPTDFFGNACTTRGDPYINNCRYDASGALLQWIYGTLQPRNTGAPIGTFVEFDQREFITAGHGMGERGWVYVPQDCRTGSCRLHVVFHGCRQYPEYQYFAGTGLTTFGMTYVRNAGYNRWADTNRLVVLYPQAATAPGNPNGCWDWWGYDDPDYAVKSGRQMAAVKRMIDRITSGRSAPPAPGGLHVVSTSDTAVTFAWSPVAGADGYTVDRDGTRVTSQPVQSPQYTDQGRASGTEYEYRVRAVAQGREGPASEPLKAKTTGTPPVVPVPQNPAVVRTTPSEVSLSWIAPSGISAFDVLRGTASGGPYARANTAAVMQPSFTDTGRAPDTSYFYVVESIGDGGARSAPSDEVPARTASAPVCTTASNYEHVVAGRAYDRLGVAHARGSDQVMGLDNVFIQTTLREQRPGFFVVGGCP